MNGSGEHDRQIGNMILFGKVAELDEANARVRVDADGMLTDWIPWTEHRAGPGVRTWSAPEVGEQVVIACPYGDPAQAAVIGSIFQVDHPAPANAKTLHRTTYADGTVVEYDRDAHRLTIDVGTGSVVINCKTATVTASDSVTIDTPTTHATGDLNVDGKITAAQDIKSTGGDVIATTVSLQHHLTTGVSSGSSLSGPPQP